jgi:CHASE2 domain-containing sensor protein
MTIKIKGKFDLRELARVGIALGLGLAAALIFYCFFALLNLIGWFLVIFVLGIILTPIAYWGIKWYKEEIKIETAVEERSNNIRI